MNQTSLVGRPLSALMGSLVGFAEKRGIWSGPLASSSPELARLWGAPTSSSGMGVDETTAYTYSVFWACVNAISTDIASFPLNLYKTEPDGGKTVLRDHPLHGILHDIPNPEMTAFTLRGLLTSNALTWGMGYAEIVRDGAGRIAQLWPITPDRVTVQRETHAPYRVYYDVRRQDGGHDRLAPDKMFVLPGSTLDGVCGRNIVRMARESIGLGLATERFGGMWFGNGSTFGGVFEHPGHMTPAAIKNFRESVNAQHQGVERAHKFIVVEEGMKYQKLGVDPDHAQFLETRLHQVEEMCRWFRMPPHKVQHLIRTSYNSVEQLNIEYTSDTLQPRCVSWEQEILRQLIAPSERRIQFVKHNMDSKLRGDTATRFEAHTKGLQNGFYCIDDVREKEDLNPLPNGTGKKHFIQSNNQPLDRVDEIVDKQVAPAPTPQAPAPAAPDATVDKAARAFKEQIDALSEQMAQHITRAVEAELKQTASVEERDAAKADAQAHEDAARALRVQIDAITLTRDEALAEAERQKEAHRLAEQFSANLETEADANITARLELQREKDAEIAGLTAERDATIARAVQAERDREVMSQTAAAADLALTNLQTAFRVNETLYADTLDTERTALEAARVQLEQLQATIVATQQEIATLAEARATSETDAATAALAAAEAHRATAEATAQLAQATADADAARKRLEQETALVTAERVAKAELTALMETQRQAHEDHVEASRLQMLDATAQFTKATAEAEATRHLLEIETARVEQERAAKAELATLMETKRKADADRKQALLPARRAQAIDQVSRVVRVETDRARRNQGTPAKIKAWAEAFYLALEDRYVEALRTLVQEHLVFIGSTHDADAYTRALVGPQLLQAVQQIRTVADGDPEDFAVSLDRLLVKWEQDRPVAIADRMFQEEMTYVRSL